MTPRAVHFSPAHQSFREQVRAILDAELREHGAAWEHARRLPKELWSRLGAQRLLGIHQKRMHGGAERDFFHSVVLLEEVGRCGYGGFRAAFAVHAYMAAEYLARVAGPDLCSKYLAPAIRGDLLLGLAMTEPHAGSDLAAVATTAVREGAHYVLNGEKAFVTSGLTADALVVVVRTSPGTGPAGLSILMLDANCDGIERTELRKIGWWCSDTADLRLCGVRVPVTNLVGRENWGFQYVMQCLQLERLVAALAALGAVDGCLALTRERVGSRRVYGHAVSSLQTVRHRLADLVTAAEATRHLVYHAAWLYQQGELPLTECSMAKLAATELANRVVDECMQLHGGSGYTETNPMARIYRDTRVGTIVGGTSEVMRDIIAQVAVDGCKYESLA